jgi:hypothetical protein
MTEAPSLGLIGRDYVLIQKLAKRIWKDLPHGMMVTPLWETPGRRGFAFEVQVRDDAGKLTGHVARVQVTLDRFEQELGEGQARGKTSE